MSEADVPVCRKATNLLLFSLRSRENNLGCLRLSCTRLPRYHNGLVGRFATSTQAHLVVCQLHDSSVARRHKEKGRGQTQAICESYYSVQSRPAKEAADTKSIQPTVHIMSTPTLVKVVTSETSVH